MQINKTLCIKDIFTNYVKETMIRKGVSRGIKKDGIGEQFREQISEEEKKSWFEERDFVNNYIKDLEQRRLNHLHDKAPDSILKKTGNPNKQTVQFRNDENLENIIEFKPGDIIPEFVRSDGRRYGGNPSLIKNNKITLIQTLMK